MRQLLLARVVARFVRPLVPLWPWLDALLPPQRLLLFARVMWRIGVGGAQPKRKARELRPRGRVVL